jgi:hypothetical protein
MGNSQGKILQWSVKKRNFFNGLKEGHDGMVVGIWGSVSGEFLFTRDVGACVKQWRVADQSLVASYAGSGSGMVV